MSIGRGPVALSDAFATEAGSAHPLGIATYPDGVNFSLFLGGGHRGRAAAVRLGHGDRADPDDPARSVRQQDVPLLARLRARLRPSTFYAFRVDGPADVSAATASIPTRS
jgi:hypothetical protein